MSKNAAQRRFDALTRRAREAQAEVSALRNDNQELRLLLGKYKHDLEQSITAFETLAHRHKTILLEKRQHG